MRHEEWVKRVRCELINRDMKVIDLCNAFKCSDTYIYNTLGKKPKQKTADMISDYLGIERCEL